MHLTHRSWAICALVALLAVLAGIFARPALLAGSVLIGTWFLARQYRFVRNLSRVTGSLTVHQWPARSGLLVGEQTPVTLGASLDEPLPLSIGIEAGVPVAATVDQPLSIDLSPGELEGERTEPLTWPITGRHGFDAATVTVTDGFFVETLAVGQTLSVTVEPRGPRHVHVGEGGDRFAVASGEHRTGRLGSGFEPAELREYVSTDSASRIDWKATARLATPYVREYEAETHRRTLLVVDHRSPLSTGPPEETKLDYLREVALSIASSANQLSDPMGLLTVGDEGITERHELSSNPGQYTLVRRSILELEPTSSEPETGSPVTASAVPATAGNSSSKAYWPDHQPTTADVRRTLVDLESGRDSIEGNVGDLESGRDSLDSGEGSLEEGNTFVDRLTPFYRDRRPYRNRIESKPLFRALRAELTREPGRVWTVLFTDDSNVAELTEAVKLARSNGNDVLVVLAPTILFERGGLGRAERTYDRYQTFEKQRRLLASMDRVTALEVAPGDRLSSVLAAGEVRGSAQ